MMLSMAIYPLIVGHAIYVDGNLCVSESQYRDVVAYYIPAIVRQVCVTSFK